MDPATGAQIWRADQSATRMAQAKLADLELSAHHFAIDSQVGSSVRLVSDDIVYAGAYCTIGKVKAASPSKVKLTLATELHDIPGRSTKQTFFRFQHDALEVELDNEDVTFPVDVTFDKADGHFQLRKSQAMDSI